jgi:hypothetical protein
VQYPHRYLEQLLLRDLEQLVARVGLEDLHQVFLVVAPLREARPLQDVSCLAADERYVQHARAIGGEGVQAEKAPLAGDIARGVERLTPT